MSDRDDNLRAAVLKVLPTRDGMTTIAPALVVADAILAAVNAVLEESERVTWGVRCVKGVHCLHFSPGPHIFGSRETAEAYIAKTGLGVHELARKRSWESYWEAVPDAS